MVSAKEKISYSEHQVHVIQGNNSWIRQTGASQDLIAAHRANLQNTCAWKDLHLTELTRSWLLIHIVFRHPQHVLLQAVSGRWDWGPLQKGLLRSSCPVPDCGTYRAMWARTNEGWREPQPCDLPWSTHTFLCAGGYSWGFPVGLAHGTAVFALLWQTR